MDLKFLIYNLLFFNLYIIYYFCRIYTYILIFLFFFIYNFLYHYFHSGTGHLPLAISALAKSGKFSSQDKGSSLK